MGTFRLSLVAALALLAMPAAAAGAQQPTRFSLAGGCWSLTGAGGRTPDDAATLRLQATALGSYLLYRADRTFLAAQADGSVRPAAEPSPAADWRVEDAGGGAFTLSPASAEGRVLTVGATGPATLADRGGAGEAAHVRFVPAEGCAAYPEADLNATGRPGRASTSYGKVGGLVEGHMHWMTFEYFGRRFHCGRPWHPYGIPYALPDCSSVEGPQGTGAPLQNFLNYGNPAQPHDTSGYPKLTEWSKDNLTYEGTYWRWIERAYLGGLRLMVMGVNENRVLCELQTNRETNCNEMDTVRRGFKAVRDLQDYVDAQAGGPGKGFFQVVTDPIQARRVINQGRMAIVLEIEISEPFDCSNIEQPTCDQAQVDRQLDEMYALGVRSMLLLNKFDNPLTGVRFDSGPAGILINNGNKVSAGSYWDAKTCRGPLTDNEIFQPQPGTDVNGLLGTVLGRPAPGVGTAPSYPPAPHCNTRGLTDLGKHVVNRMMDLKMIVNPDHMSQAGVDGTLDLLEGRRYSGVISPHGWMDPGNWPRLWKLGGVAFPGHSSAKDYVDEWERFRPQQTPYEFGWGYGADLGGLSHQPDAGGEGKSISYPFKSYDGKVTFDRNKTGDRTFDYTKEGVAQYGLYADWFEDLRRIGGKAMTKDMWDGAEAYLEMWERATGIPAPGCASPKGAIGARGRGALRIGADWETLLRRAGQPQQRTRSWSWCVEGARNRSASDTAVLTAGGRVELVGSSARGRRAGGIRVGEGTRRVRALKGWRRVRGFNVPGTTARFKRTRHGAWVYTVHGGRVTAVGAASKALSRRPQALRTAIRRLRTTRASSAPRIFVPAKAQASAAGRVTGRSLAGTSDTKLNAALALLCSLQVQGAASR